MKSILDLDSPFKYTPSFQTDVRKTFARVRLEQQAQTRHDGEHTRIGRAVPVTELIERRPAQPGAD